MLVPGSEFIYVAPALNIEKPFLVIPIQLYCGITLEWNYEERFLDISMPGYIDKLQARYQNEMPSRP